MTTFSEWEPTLALDGGTWAVVVGGWLDPRLAGSAVRIRLINQSGIGYRAKFIPQASGSAHAADGTAARSEAFAISRDRRHYAFGHVVWSDIDTL